MSGLTRAFVIRKQARGDFDRNYLLFTAEFGKISALAKGAQKIGSKMAAHLEPFAETEVVLVRGKLFWRLSAAKNRRCFAVAGDLKKAALGWSLLEAADNLTVENHPEPAIFLLLNNFFVQLSEAPNAELAQKIFNQALFELLDLSGYRPKLTASSQRALTWDLLRSTVLACEKECRMLGLLKAALPREG